MSVRLDPGPQRRVVEPEVLAVPPGRGARTFNWRRAGRSTASAPGLRLKVKDAAGGTLVERDLAVDEAREVKDAIALAGAWLREQFHGEPLLAVGHRVVHGGADYSRPVLVDEAVYDALERLIPLAPLHQPHNLAAIRAVRESQPQLPQVACFDTAFHRTHSQLDDLYALPWEYYEAGVRRYGFHGLSYEYIAATLPQVAPEVANGRVIVAHLGSGASLCALRAGQSLHSTMGFSPLDGIPDGHPPGRHRSRRAALPGRPAQYDARGAGAAPVQGIGTARIVRRQ